MLSTLLIAGSLISQEPTRPEKQAPRVSYDGCNTTTCDEQGLCRTTLAWCGPPSPLFSASQEPRQVPPEAFVVITPIEDFGDALAIDLTLIGVGGGSDLISTDFFVNRGGRELNPFGQRVEGRVALKMGTMALRGAGAYLLRRTGHKTVANVVRWVGLAFDVGITVNNVAVGLRSKK